METDLKDRVDALEQKIEALAAFIGQGTRQRDWRRTVGMSVDDPGFDEIIDLGRQYREKQPKADDLDAGS